MEIIPAILESDLDSITKKLDLVKGNTQWVQIDVGDNAFAKETFAKGSELKPITQDDLNFEIHLMVDKPWSVWKSWHEGGGDRFYFHYRSFHSVPTNTRESAINNLINQIKEVDCEVGIALELNDPLTVLEPYLDKLDCVLLMSIAEIGAQGTVFDDRVLERISALKSMCPDGCIAADGGINETNLLQLKEAGLDRASIGSGIFSASDPVSKLKELQSMVQ
jgi:ribulose-phosphate 3-epimerase